MLNTINIDTFPITEDMYQLKSIDIINSNFLSIQKWHNIYENFCKINDDYGVDNIRLSFENITSIESADIKTDHIQSIDEYEPYGTTGEPSRMFEMSRDVFKWKSFILNRDGMCMPIEAIHKISSNNDISQVNNDLSDPGRWANGLIYIVLNSMSNNVTINLSNQRHILIEPGGAVTLMQYEGIWYKI